MEHLRLMELAGLTEKKWSGDVKTKWTPPEGLFTKGAGTIVKALSEAPGGLKKAMSRLNFYINRGGAKVENKEELLKAKEMLSKKIAKMNEELEDVLRITGILTEKKKPKDEEDEDPEMDMGDDGDADDKPAKGKKDDEEEDTLPKIVKKIAKKAVGKDADALENLLMKVYDAGRKDGMKEAEGKDKKPKKEKEEMDESVSLTEKHHVKHKGKVTKKGSKKECMLHAEKNGGEVCKGDPDDMMEDLDTESAEGLDEGWEQPKGIKMIIARSNCLRAGKKCTTPKGKGKIKEEQMVDYGNGQRHMIVVDEADGTVATYEAKDVKVSKKISGQFLKKHVGSLDMASADKHVAAKGGKESGTKPGTHFPKSVSSTEINNADKYVTAKGGKMTGTKPSGNMF